MHLQHGFENRLSPEVKALVEKKKGEIMGGLLRVPINEKIPASD